MARLFICKNLDTEEYEFRLYLGYKAAEHLWSKPKTMINDDWLKINTLPEPDPGCHISALHEVNKELWTKVSNIFGIGPKLATQAKEVASYFGYGVPFKPAPPKVRFLNRQETV